MLVLNKLVASLIVVIFILVVFVIVHCHNMQNIAPHGATAAEALISSSAVVQEGSPKRCGCYSFSRVKNRWQFQNGLVAPAFHQLL